MNGKLLIGVCLFAIVGIALASSKTSSWRDFEAQQHKTGSNKYDNDDKLDEWQEANKWQQQYGRRHHQEQEKRDWQAGEKVHEKHWQPQSQSSPMMTSDEMTMPLSASWFSLLVAESRGNSMSGGKAMNGKQVDERELEQIVDMLLESIAESVIGKQDDTTNKFDDAASHSQRSTNDIINNFEHQSGNKFAKRSHKLQQQQPANVGLDVEKDAEITEKLVQLVNVLPLMGEQKMIEMFDKYDSDKRSSSSHVAAIKRKLFLNALPITGSNRVVEVIEALVTRGDDSVSSLEASEMCSALPTALQQPDDRVVESMLRLVDSQQEHQKRNKHTAGLSFASCAIAAAKLARNACEEQETQAQSQQDNKHKHYQSRRHAKRQQNKHSSSKFNEDDDDDKTSDEHNMWNANLNQRKLAKWIEHFEQRLYAASGVQERVAYIEALAHMGTERALQALRPIVDQKPQSSTSHNSHYINKQQQQHLHERLVAIYSLAHIARDERESTVAAVRDLLMPILVDDSERAERHEVRVAAFAILTMGPIGLDASRLQRCVDSQLMSDSMWRSMQAQRAAGWSKQREQQMVADEQVASFVVSTLKSLARLSASSNKEQQRRSRDAKMVLERSVPRWARERFEAAEQKTDGSERLMSWAFGSELNKDVKVFAQWLAGSGGDDDDEHDESDMQVPRAGYVHIMNLAAELLNNNNNNEKHSNKHSNRDDKDEQHESVDKLEAGFLMTGSVERLMRSREMRELFARNVILRRIAERVLGVAGKRMMAMRPAMKQRSSRSHNDNDRFKQQSSMFAGRQQQEMNYNSNENYDNDDEMSPEIALQMMAFFKKFEQTNYLSMNGRQIIELLKSTCDELEQAMSADGKTFYYVKFMMPHSEWRLIESVDKSDKTGSGNGSSNNKLVMTRRSPILIAIKFELSERSADKSVMSVDIEPKVFAAQYKFVMKVNLREQTVVEGKYSEQCKCIAVPTMRFELPISDNSELNSMKLFFPKQQQHRTMMAAGSDNDADEQMIVMFERKAMNKVFNANVKLDAEHYKRSTKRGEKFDWLELEAGSKKYESTSGKHTVALSSKFLLEKVMFANYHYSFANIDQCRLVKQIDSMLAGLAVSSSGMRRSSDKHTGSVTELTVYRLMAA